MIILLLVKNSLWREDILISTKSNITIFLKKNLDFQYSGG